MLINWPLIIVLFCISIPGVTIAVKRLIYFLLPGNTEALKNRLSRFAMLQTLLMVFILSLAGTILSQRTGLHAPILEALLAGKTGISALWPVVLPAISYAVLNLIISSLIYYGLAKYFVDSHNLQIMRNIRSVLGIDGCILYGGVVEEIIGRWGLMNLAVFFILLVTHQPSPAVIWTSIFISGLICAVAQLPAYFAAGCKSSRGFIYFFVGLSLIHSIVFGYVFWQYGLICSILSHMLFHAGWALFDNKWGQL